MKNILHMYSSSIHIIQMQGASTHLEIKNLPRHFRQKRKFLPFYVVGVLGDKKFYLGDA